MSFTRLLGQRLGWGECRLWLGLYPCRFHDPGHQPWYCPQFWKPYSVGSPTLSAQMSQAEIRVGRNWAIYGHTLGPPHFHPHSGRGHLVCEIQALFLAPAGTLLIYSMFLWEWRKMIWFWDSQTSSDSNSVFGFRVDKCSFAEHVAQEKPCWILRT